MSLLTRIFSLRRAWPPRPIDLLLRACVLPENEARAAWRTWTQETRFDDMTWPEIRLVAFLSGRIAILDPGSPLLPRVEGLGRAHWTRNQAKLRGLIQLHDALGREGIDALIFKGAAAHLEGMGALRRRVLGDVDILVRPHEMARALDVAIADGWRCVTGESPEILRVLMNRLRALNFRKDAYAEIDLHRYAFQVAANDVDEEDLWTDARRVTALERTLTVPSPAHSLVIGLTHGSSTQGGDWVLDAIARLHGPAFDWGSVVAATRRHLVVPNVRAGLLYLRECLAQDVPRSVLDELASERVAVALHLRFWAGARQSRSRRPIERVLRRAARRALRRAGYRVASGYRSSVQVMRPSTAWRRVPQEELQPEQGQAPALHHEFVLPEGRFDRAILTVGVEPPPSSRRLYFDISIDGLGIARARARAGGPGSAGEYLATFAVRLPRERVGPGRVKIEARPVAYESPMLSDKERAKIAPLPFRLRAVGLTRA